MDLCEDLNRYDEGKKASIITLITNILLMIAKITVGIVFASNALLADGFHSLSDVASTVIILISIKMSNQPPDECHPYGHGKAESIGTKILGLILIFTGLFLLRDIIIAIIENEISIPGYPVIFIAAISILVKEILYQYMKRTGERINSEGLVADAYHHRSDALTSVAVLIGAVASYLGYPIFDSLAALVVAGFIIRVGFKIWLNAINKLMDAVPDSVTTNNLVREIEKVDNVITVGNIKFRTYGNKLFVDLEVVVKNELSVIEGHRVAVNVKQRIQEINKDISDALVHIDPEAVYEDNR